MNYRSLHALVDDAPDAPVYGVQTLSGFALLSLALVEVAWISRGFGHWLGQRLAAVLAGWPAWLSLRRSPAC